MTIKILQWNINGYLNNYIELQMMIKNHTPKIICLQETHIHSLLNIPIPINYVLHTVNTSPTRFGGVAILAHKSLQQKRISVSNDFDVIGIEIVSRIKFYIYCVYLAPNVTFSTRNLENMFSSNILSIIVGDFNSHHRNWGSPSNSRKGNILSKFLNRSDFILLNDGSPTHFSTHGTFSHIDISFCSSAMASQAIWRIEENLSGSDHFPIYITLFPPPYINRQKLKPKFNTKLANWDKYQNSCTSLHKARPPSDNINREAANICKIILQSANVSIPRSKIFHKRIPWWNKKLETLKKEKNRFWHLFKRNMVLVNLLNYKRANAVYKREIKAAKRASIYKLTSTITPNSPTDKIWQNIRNFTGYKSTTGIHCIASQSNLDTMITNHAKIASEFGKYWSEDSADSKFSIDFRNRKTNITSNLPTFDPCESAKKMETKISFIELASILRKLKGKTPGMDQISYPMLKMLPLELKQRTLDLYNNIFTGHIPQQFKNSVVIPILKAGKNKTLTTSYRPISLNSCLSKIMDRIIANRLGWFVTTNKLLSNRQYGFRKGSSTTDALLYVDYQVANCLSLRKHLTIVSLDFERAFEKIGIHSILEQLIEWKVGPNILRYVKNFMSKRRITVRVNHQYSESFPLHNGIPQGSPLSVILFLIAYNRLCSIISLHREIDFCSFADDFNLIIRLPRNKRILVNLDSVFADINDWCNLSGASLSVSKCKYIHICRLSNCNCDVRSSLITLSKVDTLRILGLFLNKRYNWKDHVEHLQSSISRRLDILKFLANQRLNCNIINLISITKALVLSKINYGLPFFGYSPKSQINKLNTIINACIRTSFGALRSTPTTNLRYEANIRSILTQRDILTTKLYRVLILGNGNPLDQIIRKVRRSKRTPRVPSLLYRIIGNCDDLGIPTNSLLNKAKTPPWFFRPTSIDTSLHTFSKPNTPPLQFRKMFAALKDELSDHEFIYTDGSKNVYSVSYSITTDSRVLKVSHLKENSSVFSAEIIALYEALLYVRKERGKFAICTDSLSVIKSVLNILNNEDYVSNIRNILMEKASDLKIIWVPGHSGIIGNELADNAAKNAAEQPLYLTTNLYRRDLERLIYDHYTASDKEKIFSLTSNWYKMINTDKSSIYDYLREYGNRLCRLDYIKLLRLRLGHTRVTHGVLFDTNTEPFCNCAINLPATPQHFLCSCPQTTKARTSTFHNSNPLHILSHPTTENIILLTKFLKKSNLYNRI